MKKGFYKRFIYPCLYYPNFLAGLASFLIIEALFWGHLYILSRNIDHAVISFMAQGGGSMCLYVFFKKKK